MSNFTRKLNHIANDTDLYLRSVFSKQNINSSLLKSMKYGIFSGGKRFRSAIVVNTGKIFNINYKKLIIIGAAIECIHSYSLIHDDLPAMDNDDIRRGKLSTHKKFSESTAILSGNSLLSLAFEILSNKELNINQGEKSNLINTLSNYCGHSGLAGGQYSDLSFENKKISKKNIINMQKKKTGKLFSFCCESVAIISKRKKNERNFLRDLGLEIGLLFQIADDIIDYKGDSLTAGKPTKRDKVKGKATLISIKGYNETLNFANYLRQSLKNKIKRYGNKAKDLSDSIDFMLIRNF